MTSGTANAIAVKLLEHGMKNVVERVLEQRLCRVDC